MWWWRPGSNPLTTCEKPAHHSIVQDYIEEAQDTKQKVLAHKYLPHYWAVMPGLSAKEERTGSTLNSQAYQISNMVSYGLWMGGYRSRCWSLFSDCCQWLAPADIMGFQKPGKVQVIQHGIHNQPWVGELGVTEEWISPCPVMTVPKASCIPPVLW